jgi:hypothetical protein
MKNLPLQSLLFSDSKDTKITTFLKAMPGLCFSEKGLENIAKRFNVSVEHIQSIIKDLKGGNSHV